MNKLYLSPFDVERIKKAIFRAFPCKIDDYEAWNSKVYPLIGEIMDYIHQPEKVWPIDNTEICFGGHSHIWHNLERLRDEEPPKQG